MKPTLIAVAAVTLTTLVRMGADVWLGERLPVAFYYVAVAVVAVFAGLHAAIICTLLSAVAGTVFFLPRALSLELTERDDLRRLILFVGASLTFALVVEAIRWTRERLRRAAEGEAMHARVAEGERHRLRDLIQSVPGIVFESWGRPDSNELRINYISEYAETLLGYPPQEWMGAHNLWLDILHPDDRARAADVASSLFANAQSGDNEFRVVTKDGRIIWMLARSRAVKDAAGRPVGMRGIAFDITEQKAVEQRLSLLAEISTQQLAVQSFDALAQQIAVRSAEVIGDYCLVRMLRHGQLEAVAYAHAQPEAAPMLSAIASYSNLLQINTLYADIVRHPHTIVDNALSEATFAHVNRTGIEPLFERFRATRAVLVPLMSQGSLVGVLAFGRAAGTPYSPADVQFAEAIAARASLVFENADLVAAARQDAAEATLARQQAEAAGRAKDEFLATLSHELRTPLNAILGWAHMLRDPDLPADRHHAAIDTILRNAQVQEQLIADILDVQGIMTGKIRLNLESVDLAAVVASAAETVQPSAQAKRIVLDMHLDSALPPIQADPDRLQQVVWNLLSNAIKFAPAGGHVRVCLEGTDDHAAITVEDNGPGIPPEFLPYVFEPFRQADSSTTRTHKGLGLGLAIVRSLVEMHGGAIDAGNRVSGQPGAMFTMRLPLASALGTSAASPRPEATVPDEIPSLSGVRVLVVEDDGDARELVGTVLQRCGAEVTLTGSVSDGLQAFERDRPDVVVSDIEMPHEDGYAFIRRIRARPSAEGGNVPAAALTAYASLNDRVKMLGAGFNVHVAKPVRPSELAAAVAALRRVAP